MQSKTAILQNLSLQEKRQLQKEALLGLFFPRRCPFCPRVIGYMQECDAPDCIDARQKERLSVKTLDPVEYYLGDLSGAAAVYRHKGTPRDAVLHLKYGSVKSAGRQLGNIMTKELFGCTFSSVYGITVPNRLQMHAGYHVIIPVPPSDSSRGYNVPSLLAASLHHALGIPIWDNALQRTRFTTRQATLSVTDRFANVAGAFSPSAGLDLTGKDVLLVDDVITTGATVTACAQALYQAGANSVFAVSFTAGSKAEVTKLQLD